VFLAYLKGLTGGRELIQERRKKRRKSYVPCATCKVQKALKRGGIRAARDVGITTKEGTTHGQAKAQTPWEQARQKAGSGSFREEPRGLTHGGRERVGNKKACRDDAKRSSNGHLENL